MRALLLGLLLFAVAQLICGNDKPTYPAHTIKPPTDIKPPTGTQTCPAPTPEILRCMRQWACQYVVRLDFRCLLNLNGNPLLGGLLGGGGGGDSGGGGLLGNLLGITG